MIFGEKYLTGDDVGRQNITFKRAWLPLRLFDGRRIWMERYALVREVRYVFQEPIFFFLSPEWVFVGRYPLNALDRIPQPACKEVAS